MSCNGCGGDGYVVRDVSTDWGPEARPRECDDCGGTGKQSGAAPQGEMTGMGNILNQLRKLPSYQYLSEALGTDCRRTAIELIVTSLCIEAVNAAKGNNHLATNTPVGIRGQNDNAR
jgi:hypothetical protein